MFVVVHISDFHIKNITRLKPVASVIGAIRGLSLSPEYLMVAVTGDITNSGEEDQYIEADRYFNQLLSDISQEFKCRSILIACPGNHDCLIPEDSALRDLAIENIRLQGRVPDSQSVISQCVGVQRNFFAWLNTLPFLSPVNEGALAWVVHDESFGPRVQCRIMNTAWVSTRHEQQGQLFFPTNAVPAIPPADFRISMFHHPYNWFSHENARELRRVLEESSDLILTGHEHDADRYEKMIKREQPVGYVEGGVFDDGVSKKSTFNVVQIDFTKSSYRIFVLEWQGDHYTAEEMKPNWHKFVCLSSAIARDNILSKDMLSFLRDPGPHFADRAKAIALEDIFVPPALQSYEKLDTKNPHSINSVRSNYTINQLFENKYAYLLGSAQSGKTSLAKILYLHAIRRGLMPVYLHGFEITSPEPDLLRQTVDAAFKRQISRIDSEKFWQSSKDATFVVVDDFNGAKANSHARSIITTWLKDSFGYVFILSGDRTQLEDFIIEKADAGAFRGFKRYDIRSFGYHLRDVLIEKWLTLGSKQHLIEHEDLHHQIRSTADTINKIMGKNLLPAYPIFVFMVLEQLEASVPLETTSGSYGYFYEMFITTSLRQVSKTPEDVDAKYTYLASLAWLLFKNNGAGCDHESMSRFTRDHCEEYGLLQEPDSLREEIMNSRLIVYVNSQYRFAYRYLYYYFVSRHMRDNLDSTETEDVLKRAIGELHREDYANIIIFLTYLTKNKNIITLLLEKCQSLLAGIKPCNLSEDVAFLGRLQEHLPVVIFDDIDPIKKRAEMLRAMDDSSSGVEEAETAPVFEQEPRDENEVAFILKQLNLSARLLEVMGQILRNFSGSLKRNIKVGIAEECFDIGFRRLNFFYAELEKELETVFEFLSELFKRALSNATEEERMEKIRGYLFIISEFYCLNSLKIISSAIGSEKLIRTYEDVEEHKNTRALKFAQLYIRLEHFREFPEKKIYELYEEVINDIFGLTLLRMMVAEHFYLFPRSERTKQRVCGKLGISLLNTHRLTSAEAPSR